MNTEYKKHRGRHVWISNGGGEQMLWNSVDGKKIMATIYSPKICKKCGTTDTGHLNYIVVSISDK